MALEPQSTWFDQSVDVDGHGNESTWRVPSEHAQIDSKWHPTAGYTETILSEYMEP